MEVKFISNIERRFIRKGYVIIFISSILLLLAGFVVTTVANIIPRPDFGDPGYDDYQYLMTVLSSASVLVQNIGIVLFTVATFVGALRDDSLSNEVKRAMLIASGIGIFALVLFNRLILFI